MPSQLSQAGATSEPSSFAPLYANRIITGIWTNRNLLRDAATPFLYEKFYSASRTDSIIGGNNCEVSARSTLWRRPGSSVYNSAIFPSIDRFYEFRCFSTTTENIRVMADTAGIVYDATGPDTQLEVWAKSPGSGRTFFQSVGNTLFFSNGVDNKKWIVPPHPWAAVTEFDAGQYVLDSNRNLQQAAGGFTVGVTQIAIIDNVLAVTLDATDEDLPDNLNFMAGISFTFAGLAVATFLNGQTVVLTSTTPIGLGANVFSAAFAHADYPAAFDNGTVTTGNNITGGATPAWNPTQGGVTIDGGVQWINRGRDVQNWQPAAPISAPTVAQTPLPKIYPTWSKNTYYSTSFLVLDAANHAQMVKVFGTTGSTEPVWNDAGGTTTDNTVTWQDMGDTARANSTAVAVGAFTVQQDALGNSYFFKALNAGVTAAAAPIFPAPLGAVVMDGTVEWVNVGILQTWSNITSTNLSGNFGVIPVMGGGAVVIGCGVGAANGSTVALPTGYNSTDAALWNSPNFGSGGQTSGVFQASSSGGLLNAAFANRSGGFNVAASSNWAAAAWAGTIAGAVVVTTVGGLEYVAFTTSQGDNLVICCGPMANGSTVSIPAGGFSAANFINIAGLSGTAFTGNGMNIVQQCGLDVGLTLHTLYNDDSGNTWTGSANIFGIFYLLGGGITVNAVTGGTAIQIPTSTTQSLALIQATINSGSSFGLPPGYGSSAVVATCAMSNGPLSGSHVAHGWTCTMTGAMLNAQYFDSGGNYAAGTANVFAVASILGTTPVSANQTINDANGDLQTINTSGLSGSSAPSWNTLRGGLTQDNAANWTNTASFTKASTAPWSYYYSYENLIDSSESTASKASKMITLNDGNFVYEQGAYSTDPQVGAVNLYRTLQGGSTPFFMDQIPNNPAGGTWSYQDFSDDDDLDIEIQAALNHANDPPPVGFGALTYHLNCIFGAVKNVVYYSASPNSGVGVSTDNFPPLQSFTFPSSVIRLQPCAIGLLVHTLSDIYIIVGSNTANDPLYSTTFLVGIGLLSYDAYTVNGTTIYLMTATASCISLDPSAGVVDVGFPIADVLQDYDPAAAYMTFHSSGSTEAGLFVADGSASWYKLSTIIAPDSGMAWSPKATIVGGMQAVRSVETLPGKKQLLMGPAPGQTGPILYRDVNSRTDNGTAYPMNVVFGNIVIAQPGQIGGLQFFTLESPRIGKRPTMGILLGEISGNFEKLTRTRQDPPILPTSKTLYSDRYSVGQLQKTAWCRHFQMSIDWGEQSVPNELLTFTVFGQIRSEFKDQ